MASGVRTIELRPGELPFSIGRSRSQALVIDWAHEGVSGHHIDITEIDEGGATVVVHGDNGVSIAGASHSPGARVRWNAGEPMAPVVVRWPLEQAASWCCACTTRSTEAESMRRRYVTRCSMPTARSDAVSQAIPTLRVRRQ